MAYRLSPRTRHNPGPSGGVKETQGESERPERAIERKKQRRRHRETQRGRQGEADRERERQGEVAQGGNNAVQVSAATRERKHVPFCNSL